MALLNTLDSAQIADRLGAWSANVLLGATDIVVSDLHVPTASGLSMTTVLFKLEFVDADGHRRVLDLVARIAPRSEGRLFEDMDLARDFEVMRILSEQTDLAVPRARWLETDPQWLGESFVVSDRVDGEVPADDPPWTASGWVMDLTAEQRGDLMRRGLEVLVAVHALEWQGLGLGFLDRSGSGPAGLVPEVGRYDRAYRWMAGDERSPTIDAGFAWVRENLPAEQGELVLCWGDSRPGNIMYGQDGSVQGVLDWEMATIGPPELDLGWWLAIQHHHTRAIGVPLPEGVPGREETIALYERLSGRTVRDVEFFEVFAALRMSILFMRVGQLLIAGGALPADHPMPYVNPAALMLAELLGIPSPAADRAAVAGEDGAFLGGRELA
jgi:aminoglycoside phosphotransferase (APT) family kinase protein